MSFVHAISVVAAESARAVTQDAAVQMGVAEAWTVDTNVVKTMNGKP